MTDAEMIAREAGNIVIRTTPGVAVSALTWNEVVAVLTAIFLTMQIVHLAWKMWTGWRDREVAK